RYAGLAVDDPGDGLQADFGERGHVPHRGPRSAGLLLRQQSSPDSAWGAGVGLEILLLKSKPICVINDNVVFLTTLSNVRTRLGAAGLVQKRGDSPCLTGSLVLQTHDGDSWRR